MNKLLLYSRLGLGEVMWDAADGRGKAEVQKDKLKKWLCVWRWGKKLWRILLPSLKSLTVKFNDIVQSCVKAKSSAIPCLWAFACARVRACMCANACSDTSEDTRTKGLKSLNGNKKNLKNLLHGNQIGTFQKRRQLSCVGLLQWARLH